MDVWSIYPDVSLRVGYTKCSLFDSEFPAEIALDLTVNVANCTSIHLGYQYTDSLDFPIALCCLVLHLVLS